MIRANWIRLSVLTGLFLLGSSVRAPAVETPQRNVDEVTVDLEMPFPDDSERVAEILQQIDENAVDIRESASRLIAFTELPGEYSWLTHVWRVNRAQERLDEIQEALGRLDRRTDMLLDGQRAAFDVMQPVAVDLAAELDRANDFLEEYRESEMDARYVELMTTIRDLADRIVDAAGLAESLGEVRNYLEGLER